MLKSWVQSMVVEKLSTTSDEELLQWVDTLTLQLSEKRLEKLVLHLQQQLAQRQHQREGAGMLASWWNK